MVAVAVAALPGFGLPRSEAPAVVESAVRREEVDEEEEEHGAPAGAISDDETVDGCAVGPGDRHRVFDMRRKAHYGGEAEALRKAKALLAAEMDEDEA